MTFYKLFNLLHRRTDYDMKFYKVYYMMHPDKAKAKEERANKAMLDLARMTAMMTSVYSKSEYLNEVF